MSTLPRFVKKITRKDRTVHYTYNPPKRFIDLGLVVRQPLASDLRIARRLANELNEKIDAWKDVYDAQKRLTATATIEQLIVHYKQSYSYKKLSDKSKKEYAYIFSILDVDLRRYRIGKLSVQDARHTYDLWLQRGVYHANKTSRIASLLFNFAVDHEYIPMNPFGRLQRQTPEPRKVVWSDEEVRKFLEVAYSDFKWRNLGLIVQMTYAWVQRVGDIRVLKWDSIDWDKQTVTIQQSKRRATVHIPIGDDLFHMLKQQCADFDFQEYVAPKVKPRRGVHHPYSIDNVSCEVRRVLAAADLPLNLRVSDLRRTGTTQMVEGGVSMTSLMQVTGHVNPSSLKPYMKNTLRGATEALNKRVY